MTTDHPSDHAVIIEMRGVTKNYDELAVLKGLDLTVSAGEVFALLGPNGAGKTTAIEILEGYRRPDTGSATVLGYDPVAGGAAYRSRIGIVLQQTTSFERSTVVETVEMFAAVFPNPLRVEEAIAAVGLTPQRDQIADTMSGGQRRRLDVACGLVGRPEVLFLDEPTTGLDPQARRAMWDVIRELRNDGATIMLTTHYLDEAEALADRIGILLDGELQHVGAPAEIGGRSHAVARVEFVTDGIEAELNGWTSANGRAWLETDTPSVVVADLTARHGELPGLTISRPSLEDMYLGMVAEKELSQ